MMMMLMVSCAPIAMVDVGAGGGDDGEMACGFRTRAASPRWVMVVVATARRVAEAVTDTAPGAELVGMRANWRLTGSLGGG
jgi:hypothetical protein